MQIKINRNNRTPLYIQIKNSIRDMILSDALPYGFKLPSERTLAEEIGVSRNTVVMAYQDLIAEGLVTSSTKPKGYFVKEPINLGERRLFYPLSKMIKYNYTDKENLFDYIFSQSNSDKFISFAGISMDHELSYGDSYRDHMFYMYEEHETERLKKNICNRLRTQNIFVTEKNIQLVSETTQAIRYIIDLYLREGDCVIVEEPVIASTVNIFRNNGIYVACVKMTETGMDLDDLRILIKKYNPKFIYTMPNIHNPTGISMPLNKKVELLKIASQNGIPIIEENSLRDFRYEGSESTSLYAMDSNRSVLYLDTFTLTFTPGIKTAFIIGPVEPIAMMGKMIITNQTTIYNLGHTLLNEALENGTFQKRIEQLQEAYRSKRDILCSALEELRDYGLFFKKPEGGLFVWCKLDKNINEKLLFDISKEKGLLFMPGNVFFPYGYNGDSYLRLCFSNVNNDDIRKGVNILKEALELSKLEEFNE